MARAYFLGLQTLQILLLHVVLQCADQQLSHSHDRSLSAPSGDQLCLILGMSAATEIADWSSIVVKQATAAELGGAGNLTEQTSIKERCSQQQGVKANMTCTTDAFCALRGADATAARAAACSAGPVGRMRCDAQLSRIQPHHSVSVSI